MDTRYCIFAMLVYTLAGALHFMMATLHFKEEHYFRAGVYVMFLASMIVFMVELVFRNGGV